MMKLVVALTAAAAVGLFSQSVTTEHVLDIAAFRLTPETTAAPNAGIPPSDFSGRSHAPTSRPLSLTLAALHRSVYVSGETMEYEVLLENVSRGPVTLPWSPDRVRFTNVERQITSVLELEVRDAVGTRVLAHLQPQVLYGAREIPGSLLVLPPGHTARIKVPSVWIAPEQQTRAMLLEPSGALRVFAVYIANSELQTSGNYVEAT